MCKHCSGIEINIQMTIVVIDFPRDNSPRVHFSCSSLSRLSKGYTYVVSVIQFLLIPVKSTFSSTTVRIFAPRKTSYNDRNN